MIEKALRKRLQPIVTRQKRLRLAWRLSVYWFVSGLVGVSLLGANWLWGWRSPVAIGVLCISTALATVLVLYKSRHAHPDWQAIARKIEQQHPDMQALLLAAIEQEPERPDGQLGYLQEWVIGEALRHAADHDWLRSVSSKRLALAKCGWIAALLFLVAVLSQMLPARPFLLTTDRGVLARRGYHITVTPGDTTVELGTGVVILARFDDGRMPPEAKLLVGPSPQDKQAITLTKNLDDPVFGGLIPEVNRNLCYHIEYAGQSTRDYSISVYEHPALRRADAKIVYPSYTKLPEKVIKDTRQVSVVEGSHVTLTFTLNKPVTTAQLVAKDQPALDLTADDRQPNTYATSITATEDQRYELRLADAQGRTNKMPPRFAIDVHKNLPPELKPVFPNRDVLASPLEELSLEAEVSDDYGTTAYGLGYTLAGTQNGDVKLGQSEASTEKQQIEHVLPLEELDAQPDQLLTYYFWADDVGPDGKIRRTSSDIYFAEVRHFEEIFRESQSSQDQRDQSQRDSSEQRQGQQGDQLARLQKQIISATWNIKQQADQSGGADDHKEDLDVVRQSQAEVLDMSRSALTQAEDPPAIKALQAATGHMETSLDHLTKATESASSAELTPALGAEQLAYQELLKLRQLEHRIGRGQRSGRNNSARSARSERQLQQLELRQKENRYEAQRLARSEEQSTQRENLQVLNRLAELARRQNEMSNKLKELQAALRQAQTEQQKEEIRRELKRLREEQLEALRDVDELQQRMERPENRRRMAEAREQLPQTRSRIRRSAQDIEQGMVSRAITSTTRANRELEQMRDEFRRRTSGRFTDQMRDMRDQAQQLNQRQKEIADEMKRQAESKQKTLSDSGVNEELADRMDQQKDKTAELIEQMRDVSEQAETSEPLLSRKLYQTLRKASTDNVDKALEIAGELLRRNFLRQAREAEKQAGQGIEELTKGIEEAAGSVLGDESESLRLARRQLDELIRQVNDEIDRAVSPGQQQEPPAEGSRTPDAAAARANAGGQADPAGRGGGRRLLEQWDGIDPNGPLTGGDFKRWSDRLRDVEEMITNRDLRDEAARVRDRARAMRVEFKRHGKEPQWDLVRAQITNPLAELRNRLSEELAQLQSDEAIVPIDRDPVPGRYAELVRRYYENLGGGD